MHKLGKKYYTLLEHLKKMEKVAVAFSGGVDSSLLLIAAREALGNNAIGITVYSPSLSKCEIKNAIRFANKIGVKHIILKSSEIEEEVRKNPVNRCYFCKKSEYGMIKKEALSYGITHVVDGNNVDDRKDYRPGMKAKNELGISSPLLELTISKKEIRHYLKSMSISIWNKPANSCLYSRIPYGTEITLEDLHKIEESERFLQEHGFKKVRVRVHSNIARIEVDSIEIRRLIKAPLRNELISFMKSVGFQFITVDVEGYRMGSSNPKLHL